ncbi:uncharacterized protein LOC124360803 isoform X2 [Homalodisca vitripennis]|uniref:uncharacterized protein LOC124360803 isoform X2 n=1 Tax=Homalodisca vitripennis TaxID=197043 RepID=UPI001EEB813B|nr:uncharacterized protein LOC124360803 isoform X2 [Homalodisca vitripennis]
MTVGTEMLPFLNVTCAECLDLGPPPDSILAIPPPPLPNFLLRAPANHTTSCGAVCDWTSTHAEFIELPVYDVPMGNAWLFLLVTSCVGVLVIGSLFALFLFGLKQYFRERGAKVTQPPDHGRACEAVLYPGTVPDSRVLWATLTPRGTAHHVAPPPPKPPHRSFDNSGYIDPDDYLRVRPRVSSPTRIEHPNLPPLNLHRSFRRESDTAPIV